VTKKASTHLLPIGQGRTLVVDAESASALHSPVPQGKHFLPLSQQQSRQQNLLHTHVAPVREGRHLYDF